MAGRYVLESVSGRGPATGAVTLGAAGWAERRVRYRLGDGTLSAEYIFVGSFRVSASGAFVISLQADSVPSAYVWRPRADLAAGVLRLRHPDPADGPTIVETYRRQ